MPTFNANVLPSSTGFNLGSDSQEWDAFIQQLIVSGTSTLDILSLGLIHSVRVVNSTAGSKFTTINAAVDDVGASGGMVFVPPGAYSISTSLNVDAPMTIILAPGVTITSSVTRCFDFVAGSDGSSLIGSGTSSKIVFANSIADSSRLIRITGTSKITIKGCELDGNGNNAAAGEQNHNIIVTGSSTDVLISGNSIHDAQGDGVYLANVERVFVTENTFYNLGRIGVTLVGPTINNISVTNNKLRVGTRVSTSTSAGVCIVGEGAITSGAGKNIAVSGNQMEGRGLSFTSTGDPWSGVEINGNVIRADETGAPLGGAIELREVQDFVVDGNVIIGATGVTQIGIRLNEATDADTGRGIISNNTIRSVGSIGINLTGSFAPALGFVTITGNTISNCQDVGIQVDTDWPKTKIIGNTVTDCTDVGIELQDSQDFAIAGNILIDNGLRGIVLRIAAGTALGRGLVYGNEVRYTSPSGTKGLDLSSNANIDRILIFGNDLADTATPLDLGALATNIHAYMNRTVTSGVPVWTSDMTFDGVLSPLEGTLSNVPRWIMKVVDFSDMTAAATADTFTLWTLPANTMIHDVVGVTVTAWSGGSISAAVCSVGTQAGSANDLALDDNF
ncbi:hypothetical protein LCGC14_2060550, partial [marine sediment metagenome]